MAGEKKGPLAGFKIITNVADFGLLQPLARSRARLVASTLVSFGAFLGLTWWVADYINNTSSSVTLNMLLITACMLLMVAASYIEAMLLGDLLFPGRWRERVLEGKKLAIDPNSAEAIDPSMHRNFNLHFLVVVALAIITNYFGSQALIGDYMDEYHSMGFQLTRLRSDVDSEKQAALKELSKHMYGERIHESRVTKAIVGELGNADGDVQRWALFAVRQHKIIAAHEHVVGLLSADTDTTRAEAATTLGTLGDPRSVEPLTTFLTASKDNPAQAIGALRGVAMMEKVEAASAVLPFLKHPNQDVRAHAFWALGKAKATDHHDAILAIYEDESADPLDRCAALVYLTHAPTKADVDRFKDRFLLTKEDKDPECPYMIWEEYDGEKTYVIYKDTHRAKYMKIVANAVGEKERDWFYFIAGDKDKPWAIRRLATDIVRNIDGHL